MQRAPAPQTHLVTAQYGRQRISSRAMNGAKKTLLLPLACPTCMPTCPCGRRSCALPFPTTAKTIWASTQIESLQLPDPISPYFPIVKAHILT
jgi:hypothetical protein